VQGFEIARVVREASTEARGDGEVFAMAGELHERCQAGRCKVAVERIENARDGTWDTSRNRTDRN
jgi:hypothetical protein